MAKSKKVDRQYKLFEEPKYARTSFEEDRKEFLAITNIRLFRSSNISILVDRPFINLEALDNSIKELYGDKVLPEDTIGSFIGRMFNEDLRYIITKWTRLY